jgi:hypothetical protein
MTFSRKISCPYCGAVNRIPADRLDDKSTAFRPTGWMTSQNAASAKKRYFAHGRWH